jgi:predicted porin
MYTLGASEFHVNVGYAGKIGDVANTQATQATLGYNYNLSKRTKVYGFVTKVDNKANVGYATGVDGADFSSVAVGVRHNF